MDLGTACVVLSVLDETGQPVAGAYRYADVVRDGMVVDYLGAIQIVRELKEQVEQQLDAQLEYAAAAIPPGTDALDGGAIKHVIQGAGFEITALLDEPTAANSVLQISDGAIVDIGGGTTGISILKDGKVVYVADEATGGTHFSLVISGAYHMDFAEADRFKRNPAHHKELLPLLRPVIDKVSSIINRHVAGHEVKELYLAGGTCCFSGVEAIIERQTGIATYKPSNPMSVTPLGIALNCTQEAI
ncbi:ethanolamine utilization protein EutJ [Brevibacillus daliensis]|uniref:ethanolamine utilization protein EutJ n=1 Tax=Brevibacillus daliensis TaxID=2892995 RepID=UPI001E344C18|nr:ethanolamine utilization protein EutJ [Brevibacillus daliensis]